MLPGRALSLVGRVRQGGRLLQDRPADKAQREWTQAYLCYLLPAYSIFNLCVFSMRLGPPAVEQARRHLREQQPQRGGHRRLLPGAQALSRLCARPIQPGHRLHEPRRLQVSIYLDFLGSLAKFFENRYLKTYRYN